MSKINIKVDYTDNFVAYPANEDIACVVTAKTFKELQAEMMTSLREHIDWMKEDGDPIPAEFETVVLNDRSNLGGKSATDITISESEFENSSAYAASKATNSSNFKSITGYYPIYYGTIATVNATDGDFTESVLTGFGNGNSSIPSSVTTPTGTGAFAIAIPEGNAKYNSSELVLKDSKDMDFGKSHNFLTTISMLNNIENKNYKVFYITNANLTTGSASWTLSFKN